MLLHSPGTADSITNCQASFGVACIKISMTLLWHGLRTMPLWRPQVSLRMNRSSSVESCAGSGDPRIIVV